MRWACLRKASQSDGSNVSSGISGSFCTRTLHDGRHCTSWSMRGLARRVSSQDYFCNRNKALHCVLFVLISGANKIWLIVNTKQLNWAPYRNLAFIHLLESYDEHQKYICRSCVVD